MKLVKYTLAAAAALVVVAPAFAQAAPNDTLAIVLAKGATLNVVSMGATGDVAYKADGTFSGFDGQYEGTYKIDGNKLCATSAAVGEDNACVEYPAGKVSGDKFTLKHPTIGDIEVTLK
ncbi:MAG: hypothetical protein ABMA14_25125 [Hyphomonadaceae bacterium]